MNPEPYLYCKIYIDSELSKAELVERISQFAGGKMRMRTLIADGFEVDVIKNEDFEKQRRLNFPDGFLYFSYYLDVTMPAETEHEIAVRGVTHLLTQLWASGLPAVAACDFEDDLPEKGGYKSHAIPWPVET